MATVQTLRLLRVSGALPATSEASHRSLKPPIVRSVDGQELAAISACLPFSRPFLWTVPCAPGPVSQLSGIL